ncbi:MAG: hypothetical protein OXE92_10340 [Bacteroidetes bacterium]|nr:hypothetical protein [Bacteroidota bacterium]MCY4206108.1 hypothetical protein [Bacteroidota bacterium]
MGISRFAENYFVELRALSRESERSVIQDWIKKDDKAKGDPAEWVDAIAKETQVWARHIQSYAKRAAIHLKERNGTMTAEGLKITLKEGRSRRLAFCKEQAHGFLEEERQSIAKAFSDVSLEESMTRSAIVSCLSTDFGTDKTHSLFNEALEKGLLDGHEGRFSIPIPSMHTWLIDRYAR